MSPAFQETLSGNEMLLNSHGESPPTPFVLALYPRPLSEIRYYDIVTIRHKDTKVFLHSHVERYPLSYDDGRISSQGAFLFALRRGLSFIVYIRL